MPKHGARRRMLLLCAGLAIAVAGAPVHLLGPEAGMTVRLVSVLISIALAGALIALGMMTSQAKREPVTAVENPAAEPAHGVDPAARDLKVFCSSQLDEYFAGIKSELNQADRLVGDAVGNLVASFKYISKLTRSDQEIARAIGRTATHADKELAEQLLHQQTLIADQIDQELDAAATSLQFGDLVAQLLSHTTIRVEALGAALQRIDRQDEESGEPAWKPRRIHEGISMAVTVANAASRAKPVVQHGMQRGEIELF